MMGNLCSIYIFGVDFGVVGFILLGNAKASDCGTDNRVSSTLFFVFSADNIGSLIQWIIETNK